MMLFIGLALEQQVQQRGRPAVFAQVIDLLLIVMIDKGLDGGNRGVHRAGSGQGGERACQPSRQAPGPEQATALRGRQPLLHEPQMLGLRFTVTLSKTE